MNIAVSNKQESVKQESKKIRTQAHEQELTAYGLRLTAILGG